MTFLINLLDALAILACSRLAFASKANGGAGAEFSDIGASAEDFASRRLIAEECRHDVCASSADDDEIEFIALLQIPLAEADAPTRENTLQLLRVRSLAEDVAEDVLSPTEVDASETDNTHALSDSISQRYRHSEMGGEADDSSLGYPIKDLFPRGNIPFPHGWFSWEKWGQLNSSLSEKVHTWAKEKMKKVNETSPETLQRVAAFKKYTTTSTTTITTMPPATTVPPTSKKSLMQEAEAVAMPAAPRVKLAAVKDLVLKAAATVSNRIETVTTPNTAALHVSGAAPMISAVTPGKSTAAETETSAASKKHTVSQISNRAEAFADTNLDSLLEDIMDTTTKT